MLQRLPSEIFINICRLLDFDDKLNLKATSQQLNGIITKAVLLEDLDAFDTQWGRKDEFNTYRYPLDRLIEKLDRNQFDGSFVKILHLNMNKVSYTLQPKVFSLFPNVTRIISSFFPRGKKGHANEYGIHDYGGDDNNNGGVATWRNNIVKIVTRLDWKRLQYDMMWFTYPVLTELDMSDVHGLLKKCLQEHYRSTFFKNFPSLTTLTLRDARLNFEVLDAIHDNFPLVTSLRLFDTEIEVKQGVPLPASITPANSVSYLGLFNIKSFNKDKWVLTYFTRKYANLKHLVYSVNRKADYVIVTPEHANQIAKLFPMWQEDELINASAFSHVSTYIACSAIETHFFSNLPKSIRALDLDINNIDNAVVALSNSAVNITTLDLIDPDTNPKRLWRNVKLLEHIKKFTSLRTLRIPLHSSVETFTTLDFISSSITRLVITLSGSFFSIEWVLASFPSLEEFYILSSKGEIMGEIEEEEEEEPSQLITKEEYPNLRILSIKNAPLNPDFFDFIKTATPNLEQLNLYPPLFTYILPKYDLSNWKLKECNIQPGDFHTSLKFLYCTVTIQDASKCFVLDRYTNELLPVRQNHVRKNNSVSMEVVADHVERLTVSGFNIVKVGNRIGVDL